MCQNKTELINDPDNANTTKTDFGWSASVTSIKDYPIEVHKGYLATKKEFITALKNNGIEDDGWDVDGQEGGSGGNQIPTLLSLKWVSYAEKKFWLLDEVTLPADKILALFREGFYNKDNVSKQQVHETYKHIVIGVAPGDVVVVFLTGNYHRVEIARYQAKETFVDINVFYDNPNKHSQQQFFELYFNDQVSTQLQAKIKNEGIPFGLWDTYRKRYNWRFDIQFYKEGDKIEKDLEVKYINGEENDIKLGAELKFMNRALPKEASFYYKTNWNEATFDEDEIVSAFEKVTKNNPEAEVIIVAKVQFMYKGIDFTVKCDGKEVPLQKVKIQKGGYN
ncbi:hypothetical protein OA86_14560 [Kaistella jeonii]|uniref:DUF2931 family protein n=2 Tax=Kaistella jeonii TaxID=266749 RepID=A0A0C1FBS0_9FLAO|nr:hypothetical protein OA86_14560 [Kaistella jeonii]